MSASEYFETHYGQLVGMTITSFEIINDDDGKWPQFTGTSQSGETVIFAVSRDPEGNGPGHLFIEIIIEKP